MIDKSDGQAGEYFLGTSGTPAVSSTQWILNAGLPMLNKYWKFDYAEHISRGNLSSAAENIKIR